MGNQQPAMSEQAITKYYKDLINQNKENFQLKTLSQTESRNRLKPTSKANLDLKIQSRSSEKTLKTLNNTSTKTFIDEPNVSNPLRKLQIKKQSSQKKLYTHQREDSSYYLLEDLLKNMVKHQDSSMTSSNCRDQTTREQSQLEDKKKQNISELDIDLSQIKQSLNQETPLFQGVEDRPLQFNFDKADPTRKCRSKTFEQSFKNLILEENRCQPFVKQNLKQQQIFEQQELQQLQQQQQQQQQKALQFLLQNCTQTQSRTNVIAQQSANITFDSLESDYKLYSRKQSKYQLETPGTAQFSLLNNEKLFDLSTSNFVESQGLQDENKQYSRRTSCKENVFLLPVIQNKPQPSRSSYESNRGYSQHPEEEWMQKSKIKLEYKKIMLMLEDNQENILDQNNLMDFSIHNKSEIITNSFSSLSEINKSQRTKQPSSRIEIDFKLNRKEDTVTQTVLNDLQKQFIKSQQKIKTNTQVPYWKLRESEQSKKLSYRRM